MPRHPSADSAPALPRDAQRRTRVMRRPALAALSAVALLALSACGPQSQGAPATEAKVSSAPLIEASPALYATEKGSIADVVEGVLPSVVSVRSVKNVRTRSPADLFFGGGGRQEKQGGLGSGVILTADGLVVTNNHVIDGADEVTVQIFDDREFQAKVVGADPKSDVAVLQLQGEVSDLVPVRIGDSAALRLGDVVLAVGNPFGVGQTVTMGIVSATGRADMGIVDYENFIQTDAAINPGNSGGALINTRGELVGINTAILSRSGGSQGIGFAIPTNMAGPIVEALRTDGQVTRGFLGVRIQELDSDLRAALQLGEADGVLIADVQKAGPADIGGLKSGDVVTHVGKAEVTSAGQFRNLIASSKAESTVGLTVLRGGESVQLKIELGALPTDNVPTGAAQGQESKPTGLDGLAVRELDDRMRQRLNAPAQLEGIVVMKVLPGSKASEAGLVPGDVVVELNQQKVGSVKSAQKLYQGAKGTKLLKIWRQGSHKYIVVK